METIDEYKVFSQHIALSDYTMVREVNLGLPQGNYSYKIDYGFFFVKDLCPIRQSIDKSTAYEMTLYHPGFDEYIKVLGIPKIRALR